MTFITRRNLILSSAAGAAFAATGVHDAFAQGDKPTVTVGSKDFTESLILGQLCAHLLEDAGYEVDRQLNLGGTVVVHEATVNGDVDLYVEYTGTGLIAILGRDLPDMDESEASTSPEAGVGQDPVYDIVSEAYPEEFGIELLKPWGFNNTYVIAVRPETAEEHGLEKVSDLQGVAATLSSDAARNSWCAPTA